MSFEIFHDRLAPYGRWTDLPKWGEAWIPEDVPPGWRPYTDGRWFYTEYGWTWNSDFEWGWAPFHYGRWVDDAALGWAWIPGYEWGPAWVAWRDNDDFLSGDHEFNGSAE